MMIAVTGSSGLLGRATVERLRADGHDVLGLDIAGVAGPGFTRVDFTDYGQTLDSLLGITARHGGLQAVVHLAAIPVNGLVPDAATFHNNMSVSFNVLFGALRAGIRTIVYASSITAMGFPFTVAPAALPVDETAVGAYNTYGLGKVLEESMASQFVTWHEGTSITALRYTNVVAPDGYATFARAGDPSYRRDLIGSYVDARDGALAVSLALQHARPGFEVYNIAAPDSGLSIPTAQVAADWFPDTPITRPLAEFESLMSTDKAQQLLGFRAEHLWRNEYRA